MSRLTTLTCHFSDYKEKPAVTQDWHISDVCLDTFWRHISTHITGACTHTPSVEEMSEGASTHATVPNEQCWGAFEQGTSAMTRVWTSILQLPVHIVLFWSEWDLNQWPSSPQAKSLWTDHQPFTKNIISLNRAWHCVESRDHASWGPMCTQRPLMEAGDGQWLWPSSWWRFSPTVPSRASASSSRTWWRSTGRPTVGSPGSFPSACLSWPSMVSTADEVELMAPDKTQ